MKSIGDGKKAGRFTGLGVAQFANAVIHSLRSHEAASTGEGLVTELPIDQITWRKTFEHEFPGLYEGTRRSIQSLIDYCAYYNGGVHKLGYDKHGRFDFGTGVRDRKQGKGMSVAGTGLVVRPGSVSGVQPMEAIGLAKRLWDDYQNGGQPQNVPVDATNQAPGSLTIAEQVLRAAVALVGPNRATTFSRDQVRRQLGVASKDWTASYGPTFQGMRVDQPGGAPKLGDRHRNVFHRVVRAKYAFTEKGWRLANERSEDEELAKLAAQVDQSGYFLDDTRTRKMQEIVVRQGQPEFRRDLIAAYNRRCAVTGCDALEALESAHIVPYCGKKSNRTSNGLLLRSDIHTLFDLNLLGIHPLELTIVLDPRIRDTSYAELHGKAIYLPDRSADRPDPQFLAKRFPW